MPRRVFITVAEVSGDQHAAELIHSLKQLDGEQLIEGIGGPLMAAAGAHIHHETTRNAAMSVHAVRRVVEVLKLLRWTREHFAHNRPDLHICVDSPAMNLHFAKLAHRMRIPVMYYIAPQLWAWREGRMRKLKKWVDRVACILPFEEEYFRRHGVRATFVGHPLFDELPRDRDSRNSSERFPQRPPVIGLLAGSRASEAKANFPPMLEVAERVLAEFPQATFCSPTTEATHPIVLAEVARRGLPVTIERDAFDAIVPRCDLCLTVSGTATLHVAGWGVPMIVVYRVNRLLWQLLGRWIVRTRTYSLVNLLADAHAHIVPEFIPWHGSSGPVAECMLEMLRDPPKLEAQREALRRLVRTLDRPGASMNAARLAMEMMIGEPTTPTMSCTQTIA
jgi:lipid-A-disaccharide synthase